MIVTTGSSAGFVLAFLSLFDPGERVAITAPGYPAYRNILAALGLEPVVIPLTKADGWIMTAEAVARAHAETPLAGVLAMSPANPSGTMIGGDGAGRARRDLPAISACGSSPTRSITA